MSGSGKNTKGSFQINDIRHLVVLVRFKPGNLDGMAGAEGLLGGVAGAVGGVASAIDSVASFLPGYIKEEKEKEKKADKEYNYFKEYDKGWDKKLKQIDHDLLEMNEESKTLVHDFEESDTADKRKQEGKKLHDKIKKEISDWTDYPSAIHFIGLGQGGNIANEAASLFKDNDSFKKETWFVKSVIYVGTPLYKDIHTLDPVVLKGKGKQISLGNRYDLTQNAIEYFEPADKLRKYIETCNSNLFSYFAGNIFLHLIQALSYVLGNHEMGIGKDNEKVLDAFEKAKGEITGMIEDIIGLVKKLASEAPGMIDMSNLPKFGEMLQGYDAIPGEAGQRITHFIEDDLKKVRSGFGLSTDKLPIENFFNCLVPLFNKLTASFKLFNFDTPATNAMLDQLFDKAGVKKVYAPASISMQTIEVDDNYTKILQEKLKEKKPEMGGVMVAQAKNHITEATKTGGSEISKLSIEQKSALGAAITSMALPMLATKKALYTKLLDYLPLSGINGFLGKLTGEKGAEPLKDLVGNIRSGFDFDKTDDKDENKIGLKTAIARFDKEFNRVKGYLNSKNFPIDEQLNSLYFIYNSHNLMLKEMNAEIRQSIDTQTGVMQYKLDHGYDYDRIQNEYVKKGESEKKNVKPVEAVEEKK
ncbi:MAG: hypothetical protein H7122_16345 [Chitinophagaceae bacterium]|nr:hypothetical protein [Chitinophagaceae bacterium]